MILDEVVSWYQKKIGTYDKEKWEKTVEQLNHRDGFNFTFKTAKLKTDLIDVDLVRGSTFPKAKPKQSLLTVIRLAILRYLFLPLYSQWWVKQTSPNAFGLLFFLYITQLINLAFYTFNLNRLEADGSANSVVSTANANRTTNDNAAEDKAEAASGNIVSLSELLIPMALSLLLSLIHSQIVATNIAQSGVKCKRRRYSSTSLNGRLGKYRRRKKLVKLRSHDLLETSSTLNSNANSNATVSTSHRKPTSGVNENIANIDNTFLNAAPTSYCGAKSPILPSLVLTNDVASTDMTCAAPRTIGARSPYISQLKLDLKTCVNNDKFNEDLIDNGLDCSVQKRNVNWHSPIHNYATSTEEKQQQTSPQSVSTTSSTSQLGDNSSVSSNSSSISPKKIVRVDECVQEFYDDLINRTSDQKVPSEHIAEQSSPNVGEEQNIASNNKDDDGFESLNGKSSSGEDTHVSPNVLRLRLNVASDHSSLPQLTGTSQTCFQRKVNSTSTGESNHLKVHEVSSDDTGDEGDDGDLISSPASQANNDCTTSAEWLGITTNSDECSYSSDYENSEGNQYSDENVSDMDFTPTTILNPHGTSDRISCTIWDHREIKKAQMSVLEISSTIIESVESMPETNDYIYIGIFFSVILSLIPCFCRLCEVSMDSAKFTEINYFDLPMILWEKASFSFIAIFRFAFGETRLVRAVLLIGFIQRLCLTLILFMIFGVAERTFKQRFLYAKLFSHLTSSRRARKSNLPHFRLNKVRNIKAWLSIRSYLKKRGPQRSVDIIVSAAFIITLLLLAFLSVEWLKDSVHLHSHLNLEALLWSSTIGIFLLRFMTLGNKIHHKYRSVSVLITEQINLYLQIEKKPKKKEELMVSNSVLKLAADLLKELETPFKISGLSANPYLFTTIKVVILSALSGVLSEMLGFKLKLHKIKIK